MQYELPANTLGTLPRDLRLDRATRTQTGGRIGLKALSLDQFLAGQANAARWSQLNLESSQLQGFGNELLGPVVPDISFIHNPSSQTETRSKGLNFDDGFPLPRTSVSGGKGIIESGHDVLGGFPGNHDPPNVFAIARTCARTLGSVIE